jgi:type IV fimbrial biogenesis protein FimT
MRDAALRLSIACPFPTNRRLSGTKRPACTALRIFPIFGSRGMFGFSVFELLVSIGIAGILLTLAIPSFTSLMEASRLSTYSNVYLTHLHFARSEALKRNGRVALCKSTDGASCSSGGHWSQGWLVFHDSNNNAQVDSGEAILRVHQALPISLLLKGNLPVADYVSYANSGGSRLTSGAFQAGTVTLCRVSADAGESRRIVISATGRPRVERVEAESCS